MSRRTERVLLHLARDRRRALEPADIYYLEATGETTLVRTRSARRLRDGRALGELVDVLGRWGIIRIHRNHAVNVDHVHEIRRRRGVADWEVRLDPPVNKVLPVSRTALNDLWTAFRQE
jgi:DNA-binding LytR/AlgR family response regulator